MERNRWAAAGLLLVAVANLYFLTTADRPGAVLGREVPRLLLLTGGFAMAGANLWRRPDGPGRAFGVGLVLVGIAGVISVFTYVAVTRDLSTARALYALLGVVLYRGGQVGLGVLGVALLRERPVGRWSRPLFGLTAVGLLLLFFRFAPASSGTSIVASLTEIGGLALVAGFLNMDEPD